MKDGLLEVGDELYTYGRSNTDMFYTGKIDRVTATMAFIGSKKLRRKYTGHAEEPGEFSYNSKLYYLIDEESRQAIIEQRTRRKLLKPIMEKFDCNVTRLDSLSNSQLERINTILQE
jgi:hypothetical protein